MDNHTELLKQIKRDIDKALRLAEVEEYKVKDHRSVTRLQAKAHNYENLKVLLKTISKNISFHSDLY